MSHFDDNEHRITHGPNPAGRRSQEELSTTMQAAIKDAIGNGGGYLKRFPGGFWRSHEKAEKWHSKLTIDALIRRGLIEVTQRQGSRTGGSFIIEVKVKL